MRNEHAASRYRRLYASLLRLYPKPYRERFEEGMLQTFRDLCYEHVAGPSSAFALRAFGDTAVGIIKEHVSYFFSSLVMTKNILRLALVTACLLMIPLVAMQFTTEVNWTLFDFVFAGTLIFGTGLAYEFLASRGGTVAYRVAVGVALATAFLLIWVNAAVGIIGDGDLDSPNGLYVGVLAIGFFGALIARFHPRGMSYTLFATAIAQLAVPVIALFIWSPQEFSWAPGVFQVFVLNACFAMLFVVSGLLFGSAARKRAPAIAKLAS